MSIGLNKVMLLGDIANDPEVYVTRGGMVVMSFKLAVAETYVDREDITRERIGYHPVIILGRRADQLSKVMFRGARVFVEGGLRTSTFESLDGKKWNKTEIVATEILYAGERAPDLVSPSPHLPENR